MNSRDRYLHELESRLNAWHTEIEILRQKASHAERDARAELEKHIAELDHRCEAARKRVAQMRAAQDVGWEDLCEGCEQLWGDIKQLLNETKEAFQEGRQEGP